jgi:undecaprenyl diphosphate synthase
LPGIQITQIIMSLIDTIDKNKLPAHVAIIMDGNGRWAKQKGKPRIYGHQNGANAVKATIEAAAEIGVPYLTLYAFSTENWNRPKMEVDALMALLVDSIDKEIDSFEKNSIRLKVIGDIHSLPEKVQKKLDLAINRTSNGNRLTLIVALSYSSRWEIVEAAKKLAADVQNNNIEPSSITSELFEKYLNTEGIPDPELLIRTSGEFRLSNFLLWQAAYSELYSTDVLWPDFNKDDFFKAVINFQSRERRFGKTSEQL